ncbi:DUF4386 domain-containing protein [Parasphingorhabdus sp.]|uniref:DUF4386 domain-containing protein n=1 Tax=Parasphingorhabdus sp. TaxID=2709688 RepID=UPI003A8D8830
MARTTPHRLSAALFGMFFILTFVSYGVGLGLIDAAVTDADFLLHMAENERRIVIGVILTGLVHTVLNIGLAVIMLPIMKPFSERLAFGYFSAAIAATVILAVGALLSLMLSPLGGEAPSPQDYAAASALKAGGVAAYHLGMALWSVGGVLFCAALFQSRLVPRWMSVWGMIGYPVLLAGSIYQLFGPDELVATVSVIPGGLFEITLSLWLIVSGFNNSATRPGLSGSG